jgi:hypothetical protein
MKGRPPWHASWSRKEGAIHSRDTKRKAKEAEWLARPVSMHTKGSTFALREDRMGSQVCCFHGGGDLDTLQPLGQRRAP